MLARCSGKTVHRLLGVFAVDTHVEGAEDMCVRPIICDVPPLCLSKHACQLCPHPPPPCHRVRTTHTSGQHGSKRLKCGECG